MFLIRKKTNNSASQGTPTSSQPSVLSAYSEDTPDGNKKTTKAKASKKQKSGEIFFQYGFCVLVMMKNFKPDMGSEYLRALQVHCMKLPILIKIIMTVITHD